MCLPKVPEHRVTWYRRRSDRTDGVMSMGRQGLECVARAAWEEETSAGAERDLMLLLRDRRSHFTLVFYKKKSRKLCVGCLIDSAVWNDPLFLTCSDFIEIALTDCNWQRPNMSWICVIIRSNMTHPFSRIWNIHVKYTIFGLFLFSLCSTKLSCHLTKKFA